jgi:hypothetical protein
MHLWMCFVFVLYYCATECVEMWVGLGCVTKPQRLEESGNVEQAHEGAQIGLDSPGQ